MAIKKITMQRLDATVIANMGGGGTGGTGDMAKVIYDTNDDGKVNAADTADSVPYTGVTGKPSSFPPSTHNHPASEVTGLATVATTGSYTNLSNKPTLLALGTTSTTAYRGDYGSAAYSHSQTAHAPTDAQKNSDITKAEIEAKLIGTITTHTHSYNDLTNIPAPTPSGEPSYPNVYRTNKVDGIFTTVEFKREDGTLAVKSQLVPPGSGPNYPTRMEYRYDATGLVVTATLEYDLSYDTDGDLISEVIHIGGGPS